MGYNQSGFVRGPLAGAVSAVGYIRPACILQSCESIDRTELDGGVYRYSRENYGPDESAMISFSGPARVIVTELSTEPFWDFLQIGGTMLSGKPDLPLQFDVSMSESYILWYSDKSV